ncbi:MAG: hypothetical protein E7241_07060 [Lachnospiraceae bacterium]|nr:hypothetical protein [Lachnospiraceae bacterium]
MIDDYKDIIDMEYPFPGRYDKHPPMAVEERAKIFGSFAALKGHEDRIEDKRVAIEDMVNNHLIEHEDFFD